MISTSRAEVPEYLRRSKFFQALGENDFAPFSVPQQCYKLEPAVDNAAQCLHLLRTLNFWMVDEPQVELMVHLLTSDVSGFEKEGSDERNLLLKLKFGLEYLKLRHLPDCARIAFATKCMMGVTIVEALNTIGSKIPNSLCSVAAEVGDLDVLQYARSHHCKWGDAAQVAVIHGHVECVRYTMNRNDLLALAVENGQLASLQAMHAAGAVLDGSLCPLAARCGQIKCLQYLHEQGAPWDSRTMESAVAAHQHDCLIFAHQHHCPTHGNITALACAAGNYVALRYLSQHNVPMHATCTVEAASKDNLLCLKYARLLGAVWDVDVCQAACAAGAFDCLRYAREHDCPWDEGSLIATAVLRWEFSILLYVSLESAQAEPFRLERSVRPRVVLILLIVWLIWRGVVSLRGSAYFLLHLTLAILRHLFVKHSAVISHYVSRVNPIKCALWAYALIFGSAVGLIVCVFFWVVYCVILALVLAWTVCRHFSSIPVHEDLD